NCTKTPFENIEGADGAVDTGGTHVLSIGSRFDRGCICVVGLGSRAGGSTGLFPSPNPVVDPAHGTGEGRGHPTKGLRGVQELAYRAETPLMFPGRRVF